MHDAIQRLKNAGWTAPSNGSKTFELPKDLQARHGKIPPELVALLVGVKKCAAPDGKAGWRRIRN